MFDIAVRYMSDPYKYKFDLRPYAHPLKLLSKVYTFGDKYLVTDLAERARSKLLVELSKSGWSCKDFLLAVQCIYAMTGRRTVGLRRFLLGLARSRLDELVVEPLFVDIVRNLPEFTACLGSTVRGRTRRRQPQRSDNKRIRKQLRAQRRCQ